MYILKNYSLKSIWTLTGAHIIWLSIWSLLVAALFYFTEWAWLRIPWLPLSVIGTSVAFYVGFKNNQAYERLWEARRIWGGIVNSSRAWGSMVRSFVNSQFSNEKISETEVQQWKEKLLFRHIGWLYTLRSQLLVLAPWEHASLHGQFGKVGQKRMQESGIGMLDNDITETHQKKYFSAEDYRDLAGYKNAAAQMIDRQAQDLMLLRSKSLIDDLRHMELQKTLNDFYDQQGAAERIKRFPLPRQYGSMSFIFVCIFIFMLPFGMVSEFSKLGDWGIWLSVPFCIMVGWIFVVMELIGDYSENPFEGLGNDVPMYSICRTIEIDLLQMLAKTDIPPAVQAKNGVLM